MATLIYGNTKNNDLLYKIKINIPDACFYLETSKAAYIFLDHREYEVFKELNKNENIFCVPVNLIMKKIQNKTNHENIINLLAVEILKEYSMNEDIVISDDFPISIYEYLKIQGWKITITNKLLPERLIKNTQEVELIKINLEYTKKAFVVIENILRESVIIDDYLYYNNKLLSCEILKKEVSNNLFLENMLNLEGIIIATGLQTAIPHHCGSGHIKAGELIICDIFPRNLNNHYFADMTRTYVKGSPKPDIVKIFNDVLAVQEYMINNIKPGNSGKYYYDLCCQQFENKNYQTDGDEGFIHGLGHGLGLDIHEGPFLNVHDQTILQSGNVVTIEPGLYFKNIGGVRLEDVVLITENGCINLTNHQKYLIID